MSEKRKRVIQIIILVCFVSALLLYGWKHNEDYYLSDSEISGNEEQEEEFVFDGDNAYTRELAAKSQVHYQGDSELKTIKILPQKKKQYTVMVYITGSNLESMLGCATKDIFEIRNADVDYSKSNIILYTGGSSRWLCDVPNDRNCVFDCSLPEGEQIVAETQTNADMGAPETLKEFVNFCHDYYPAEHNALIFWDHGGGSLWGYGCDELFDNDSLLLAEMKEAMDETAYGTGEKLDFVGFDACLMASLECMQIWSEYSKYYVGSEELEPGDGWDYKFLEILNTTDNPEEVTTQIVNSFSEYYQLAKTETSNPDLTLSCVDLSKINALVSQFNSVVGNLQLSVETGDYSRVQKVRADTKSYGLTEDSNSYDMIDLGDFNSRLSEILPGESETIASLMEECVVTKYSNVKGSSGISIYYPYLNKGQYFAMAGVYNAIGVSPAYSKYLSKLRPHWTEKNEKEWILAEPEIREDEIVLSLTDYQAENATGIYYTIFGCNEEGYWPLFERYRVEMNTENEAKIPLNPDIVCLKTDTDHEAVWRTWQIEKEDDRELYKTVAVLAVDADDEVLETTYEERLFPIRIIISKNLKTNELCIQSITDSSQDVSMGGKSKIEVGNYTRAITASSLYAPTKNEYGVCEPIEEWVDRWTTMHYSRYFDKQIDFCENQIMDLMNDYAIQIEVKDTSGVYHASNLIEQRNTFDSRIIEEYTDEGVIQYYLDDGFAEILSYEGNDTEITIPGTVEGLPVKIIGEGAFLGQNIEVIHLPDAVEIIREKAFKRSKIREVDFADGLKEIGSSAFAYTNLESITIPEGTEKIGMCAFFNSVNLKEISFPASLKELGRGFAMYCESLESIQLNGSENGICGACVIKDGVVFSRDRKKLIAYPAQKGKEYEVPDTTEIIEYGAFSFSHIETVVLPEGLKRIENLAFIYTPFLNAPVFPESLEYIGENAFGMIFCPYISYYPGYEAGGMSPQKIIIGKNVSHIGAGAFDEFYNRSFLVNSGNKYYSVHDGALCNKAGDTLISFSLDGQAYAKVPDGITYFDGNLLSFVPYYGYYTGKNKDLFELIFPDSVKRIVNLQNDNWCEYLFHCSTGSAASTYAAEHDILQDDFLSAPEKIYSEETPYGLCTYLIYKDYAVLMEYEGLDKVLEIPKTVCDVPVKVIGNGLGNVQKDIVDNYFIPVDDTEKSIYLKKIILPDGIERISSYAFDDGISLSRMLQEMNLPDSVKYIGESAITYEWDVQIDHLPESLEYAGRNFISCKWGEDLAIPDSLSKAEGGAFAEIRGVKSFIVSENNPAFVVREGYLFDKTGTVLLAVPDVVDGEMHIPDNTVRIEDYAFAGYEVIKSGSSIYCPTSLKEIGRYSFSRQLLDEIHFNEGLERIEEGAFSDCRSLKEVFFPESLTLVGKMSFQYCSELKSVRFGKGLQTIGESAFEGCEKLSGISLPLSLISVENYAFNTKTVYSEEQLTKDLEIGPKLIHIGDNNEKEFFHNPFKGIMAENFKVDENNQRFVSVDGLLMDKSKSVLYACPSGRKGEVTVPEGTVCIWGDAFSKCSMVEGIHIPDSVKIIDSYAFKKEYDESGVTAYKIKFYCKSGSYAEQFARINNIPYETE